MRVEALEGIILRVCEEADVDTDILTKENFERCMTDLMLIDERTMRKYFQYLTLQRYLEPLNSKVSKSKLGNARVTEKAFEYCVKIRLRMKRENEKKIQDIALKMKVTDEETMIEIRKIV